ncbi:MAG: phosphoribosylamine--glycine ligase [Spirochaeta sp.]|jgi:phosphoribosylamine--glycine ligase|nr:phosphoribosylamine--glycine ligase [Spirochaeta sp.]
MKIAIIGSGGREHALAWRLAQSEQVSSVVVFPGNPGMDGEPKVRTDERLPTGETLRDDGVDLVIVGPEEPLANGIADELRGQGLAVVGPSGDAARLEGSKAFAKEFMVRHGIPTAEYRVCPSVEAARAAVRELGAPVVVKADGLAAGKGVTVCDSVREADAAIESIMRDRMFGAAGDVVVVERVLTGFEASIIVLVDETGHVVLPTARDHKPIGEGNSGPNTGGMGVVAPNPDIDTAMHQRIEREIVEPAVAGIKSAGWLFRGVLFIGLMIDEDGPQTLEFNVRFGDPETQGILPLLSGDFAELMMGLASGQLHESVTRAGFAVRDGAACSVIAASAGYPGPYTKDVPVTREPIPEHSGLHTAAHLFFAGVTGGAGDTGDTGAAADAEDTRALRTSGGRVLAATAWGADLPTARRQAYTLLQTVHFDGMQYRPDIGGDNVVASVIEEGTVPLVQFTKRGGLVPVVVQDADSRAVLMVAYTNREAFETTRSTGYATFWSTSRNALWTKGETSGDYLAVDEIRVDCDQDALLYLVTPAGGGVCHTTDDSGAHRPRCFYRRLGRSGLLEFDE